MQPLSRSTTAAVSASPPMPMCWSAMSRLKGASANATASAFGLLQIAVAITEVRVDTDIAFTDAFPVTATETDILQEVEFTRTATDFFTAAGHARA